MELVFREHVGTAEEVPRNVILSNEAILPRENGACTEESAHAEAELEAAIEKQILFDTHLVA